MRRIFATYVFGIVLFSCVSYVIINDISFRVNKPHRGCIAGEGTNETESDNIINYDVIYSSKNKVWMDLLTRSYSPVYKALHVIDEEYPIAVDMVTLLRNVQNKKEVGEKKINIYPYKFINKPLDVCTTSEGERNIFLLLLIKSSYRHFERRKVIRETWANNEICREFDIARVFIVGQTKDRNRLSYTMTKEIKREGDMLEIGVIDNYYNNTYKTIGGMKYVLERCPQAEHVMLIDDDFYLATENLITLLKIMKEKHEKFIYMGWLNKNPLPSRSYGSKWYVTVENYPYDMYPEFISAGAIVMGIDFVQNVYFASQYTKYFIFDDVFIAIVAYKLHIYPQNNFLFYINKVDESDPEFWQVLAAHGYNNANDLRQAWMCHERIRKYGLAH